MPATIASMRAELSGGKVRRGRPKASESDAILTVILQAALMLFRKQGLAATSIEQIATAASASKTTIYRHFGSKEALAEAAVELDGQNVLEAIRAFDGGDPDPMVRLRDLTFAIADFTALPTSAELYRFSISAVPSVPAIGRAFAQTGDAIRAMMFRHLVAAQVAGTLRKDEPEQMTRQLYDAVVSPIWSDALLAMDYISDPALRRAIMVRNWDAFLRGGQA
jgi:AcrR family transcriptional regulator